MKIDPAVLSVLSRATTIGLALRLPEQLDRQLYVQTDKVLKALGGTWNRAVKAHLFVGPAAEAIEPALLTGEVTTAAELGYFPTPDAIAARLVGDLCKSRHIQSLTREPHILEPSAGTGALVRALLEHAGASFLVDAVEIDRGREATLRELMRQWSARLALLGAEVGGDFLALNPRFKLAYDGVVMNPPFSRQQDIAHVRHAWEFLRPGGRLVAIMSNGITFREDRTAADFRRWLSERNGGWTGLPDGAFKTSGAGVRAVVVTADKAP